MEFSYLIASRKLPFSMDILQNNVLLMKIANFISKTTASLSHVSVTKDQNVQIINNFNTNKSHGCDCISVAMLKLCAVEVAVLLQIIFNYCIRFGMFPDLATYT